MLTAYPNERQTLRIQVKVKPVNTKYGAWVTPNGILIQVTESERHFNFAMQVLYPNRKDITKAEADIFYVEMYKRGYLRLTYTYVGYKIEKGPNQIIKPAQLSICNNAQKIDIYHHISEFTK